jgi:catechol 2,3-dioxygenase
LPDATHVGEARLQVSDLDRSIGYYRDIIGLKLLDRTDDTAALGAIGADRPLIRLQAKPGIRPVPRRGAYGLYHFAILLPDRASLGRFVSHLAHTNERVGSADHLVSEALYLTDPDGLGIEVYADRPRQTWRHRDRELVMASQPLDFENLMLAGGSQTWDGVPAGTTIGHMHLHVGDLGQAEAFYHRALGLEKIAWSFPGALFFAAGGYHHHLGTNTWSPGPAATDDQARLLEWELIVPAAADASAAAESLRAAGYTVDDRDHVITVDPWGTRLRLRPES